MVIYSFDKSEWIDRIKKMLYYPEGYFSSAINHAYEKHFSAEVYYQKCLTIYEKGLAMEIH